jgi:hypothetical protein
MSRQEEKQMRSRSCAKVVRRLAYVGALVSLSLVGTGAAAETKLNPSNSILFPFFASFTEHVAGSGCGGVATLTRRLPPGATGIRVVKPRAGDRDRHSGTQLRRGRWSQPSSRAASPGRRYRVTAA